MTKALRILLIVAILAALVIIPVSANEGRGPDSATKRPGVDRTRALVQLRGEPLATYVKTHPPAGKKIDFNSTAVKSYRAQLSALRNDFKAWLRVNAPAARVVSEYDIALNVVAVELNGVSTQKLAGAPMVIRVENEGIYYPTDDDPDLAIIQAVQAWNQFGGPATAGEGVKVAIVDSGIDFSHPCFSDTGYPAQQQLGDHRFTNNKVIAAKVFNMKTPSMGFTPEAIDSHGTHVAGTVACNYNTPATVDGVTIPYGISGVAPRALLGNYNVFPGLTGSARSEDIMNALETAYADGFDVANMSLSGGSSGIQDLLSMAVDNLDQANMVIAMAAGNSGPGHYTVGSPGIAPRGLTGGASTVPHFVGAPVTVGSTTYGAASGDFATVSADLTAPLGVVTNSSGGLNNACSALTVDLTGKIALIARGTCTFSTKIRNAETAGAVAVLVANNVAGDPTAMGSDGTPNQPAVPAYMISRDDGAALLGMDGSSATISANLAYFLTTNVDIMAGFSSQGPTDVDFRVKPDVVTPGVNVLSSIPVSYCGGNPCFAFFQGTSMASPHLAGMAAFVVQQFPDWSAAQVRSAIVNTADQGVLKKYTSGMATDVNLIGSGRANLFSAVNASVTLDPVSISFGSLPSGAGQTRSFEFTLTNVTGAPATFDLAVDSTDADVTYTLDAASVSLEPGAATTVTLTMSLVKGATPGDHQAWLRLSSAGTEVAHAAVYFFAK